MGEQVWTVGEALDWTVRYFEENETPEPRRSAEWLLSDATGLSRVELYAYRPRPLSEDERATYREAIKLRAEGMPLQHVTGEVPFRTVVLHVPSGVFIPRPETEVLVDVGLEFLEGVPVEPTVVDICTGTGAIAVSIAKECPDATVYGTDVSEAAVATACDNAERIGVSGRVRILQGDLFGPLDESMRGTVDLILANPPYIPTRDIPDLPDEVVSHEPALALDGGLDGLAIARRIATEATDWLREGGMLALEIDERHAADAAAVLSERFAGVFVRQDLAGRDRIVGGLKEAAT